MRNALVQLAIALVLLVGCSSLASAQATRTWVSGVGDDANPCSRTAPCKTFAGAISKTAPGGEIDVLDPGGFGAVTITKPISIEAEGVIGGVLVSGTNGIIINLTDPLHLGAVVIRGLTIEGLGTGLSGIKVVSSAGAGSVYIENCFINNFGSGGAGIDVEPSSGPTLVSIKNTTIRNMNTTNTGGVLIKPAGGSSVVANLDHVRIENSRYGVRAEAGAKVTVSDSVLANNLAAGAIAVGGATTAELNLERTTSSGNGFGVVTQGVNGIARISNVSVFGNTTGLSPQTGGSIISFLNNHILGNGTDGAPTSTQPQQ